jgi:uncharacterized membrane protein
MKKLILVCAAVLSLSACSSTQQGAAGGAVVGGVIGAATTGSVLGTVVGAGVGAVAGAAIGKVAGQENNCYYRNSHGKVYIDTCPRG